MSQAVCHDCATAIAASSILLTNIETIPGQTITQHLGLVPGSSVRAKHLGRDIAAGLKNIGGGDRKGYTELLQAARQEATDSTAQRRAGRGAKTAAAPGQ